MFALSICAVEGRFPHAGESWLCRIEEITPSLADYVESKG